MVSNFIIPMEMQSLDTSTIGAAAYYPFNTAGIEGALSFIRITNDSDTDVIISYDGVNPHEYLESGKSLVNYFQANNRPTNYVSKLKKNTIVYAQGIAGTGYLFVSGYYSE